MNFYKEKVPIQDLDFNSNIDIRITPIQPLNQFDYRFIIQGHSVDSAITETLRHAILTMIPTYGIHAKNISFDPKKNKLQYNGDQVRNTLIMMPFPGIDNPFTLLDPRLIMLNSYVKRSYLTKFPNYVASVLPVDFPDQWYENRKEMNEMGDVVNDYNYNNQENEDNELTEEDFRDSDNDNENEDDDIEGGSDIDEEDYLSDNEFNELLNGNIDSTALKKAQKARINHALRMQKIMNTIADEVNKYYAVSNSGRVSSWTQAFGGTGFSGTVNSNFVSGGSNNENQNSEDEIIGKENLLSLKAYLIMKNDTLNIKWITTHDISFTINGVRSDNYKKYPRLGLLPLRPGDFCDITVEGSIGIGLFHATYDTSSNVTKVPLDDTERKFFFFFEAARWQMTAQRMLIKACQILAEKLDLLKTYINNLNVENERLMRLEIYGEDASLGNLISSTFIRNKDIKYSTQTFTKTNSDRVLVTVIPENPRINMKNLWNSCLNYLINVYNYIASIAPPHNEMIH